MKTFRVARAGVVPLLCLGALALAAQTRPLNPIVKVLENPAAAATDVSSECQKALAPQAPPRVEISDVAQPQPKRRKVVEPPPSKSLRSQLATVQEAAMRGDRTAYRDALARVKAMLETYPTGGERDAASAAVRVYSDLDRLWTYEFDSRTGAFFDASTGLVDMMTGYAGWQAFIEKQTVSAGGVKLYPSRESRDFLVREAAKRLSRLGITVSAKAAPAAPAERERVAASTRPIQRAAAAPRTAEPRVAGRVSHEPATSSVSKREGSRKQVTASSKETRSGSVAKRRHGAKTRTSTPRKTKTLHATAPATATPKKAPAAPVKIAEAKPVAKGSSTPASRPVSTSTRAPEPSSPVAALTREAESSTGTQPPATPGAMSTVATSTSAASTASEPPVTNTEAPAVSTSATATEGTALATSETATASTATDEPHQQPQGRSVILPIILIVVGLGVLIVLFRASS